MLVHSINQWFARRSFQNRIFLLILFTSSLVMTTISWFLTSMAADRLDYQVGQRALIQAMQISAMPELVDAVSRRDTARIKALIEPMRSFSDATYITIGDETGIRLYHVSPLEIGKPMEGGDNDRAFQRRESYVSLRQGSLGTSLRGKSPIQNSAGKVIGVVSVGYSTEQLQNWLNVQLLPIVAPLLALLFLLLLCAHRFSLHIKKQMFNMEPQQIARLVIEQSVLFESVFEGLLAIDSRYKISAINQAARQLLQLKQTEAILIGKTISQVVSPAIFFYSCPGENKKDEIVTFNGVKVIASRMAVLLDGSPQGWVVSFRSKDDINILSLQLSQIQQYADNLRAVQHEHRNLISTLAGLLSLKRYEDALALLQQQSEGHQKVLDFINRHVQNNHLAGLLMGKYCRAKELGLELVFDPGSHVSSLPDTLTPNEWISIVGNLLDNAFNATLQQLNGSRQINCLILSGGSETIIEVADEGVGINCSLRPLIFERGVTTSRTGDHGIGLWLVRSYVEQAGGQIVIEENLPQGTIFTVYIPHSGEKIHGQYYNPDC